MTRERCGRTVLAIRGRQTLRRLERRKGSAAPLAFRVTMCNDIPDPIAVSSPRGEEA